MLDSFGGTLLVISHDRYFLERVCDRFVGLLGDGELRDLRRGVEQYLEQRESMIVLANQAETSVKKVSNAAQERQIKKDIARLDRQIEKANIKLTSLLAEEDAASFTPERLIELAAEIASTKDSLVALEAEWLSATLSLEN